MWYIKEEGARVSLLESRVWCGVVFSWKYSSPLLRQELLSAHITHDTIHNNGNDNDVNIYINTLLCAPYLAPPLMVFFFPFFDFPLPFTHISKPLPLQAR